MNSKFVFQAPSWAPSWQRSIAPLQWAGLAGAIASALIALSPGTMLAQSTNRDAPTPLTSNVLIGQGIHQQTQNYFYSFTAGPGELVLTLDADAGTTNGNGVLPNISLQDRDGNEIASISAFASPGAPSRSVKRVNIATATPVIVLVTLPGGSTAGYTYRLQLSGAVQIAQPMR